MAATSYTLTTAWSATNRYLAAAETGVLLSHPGTTRENIAFTTTMSTADPTITPAQAAKLAPLEKFPMTLVAGEYLWMASLNAVRTERLDCLQFTGDDRSCEVRC